MKSLWKGALSFGLVNIPIELFSAAVSQEIKFTLLHESDLSPIRYARICKAEDKEVPWNEIVKGYENEKGNYIVMSDEDLKKAMASKSKTIEILQFTDEDAIDSIYYEKPYALQPQKGSEKAYALLVEALKKSKKIGIAQYALHNRAHIGALKVYQNLIMINQLRYESEIVDMDNFKIPTEKKVSPKEMDIALQLINHMTSDFHPEQYKDTYVEDIKEIIRQKEKGKKFVTKKQAAPTEKVHDIMSLLKASLEEKEKKPKRKRSIA